MSKTKREEVVSNLTGVPTIFIDGVYGLNVVNGVAKLGLYEVIQDLSSLNQTGDAESKKVIVGRLAMSLDTLVQLREWLSNTITLKEEADGTPSQDVGQDV